MKTLNQFNYHLYIHGRLRLKGTCDNFPFMFRGEPIPEGSTLRIRTEGEHARWYIMTNGEWDVITPAQYDALLG